MAGWISDCVAKRIASGAVITPWATPWISRGGPGRKPGAQARVHELQACGVETWFDPMTHALQMSGVGDFRYYDQYSLWAGPRGDLSDQGFREEHVSRVFDVQNSLHVRHLAPTVLLHAGLDNTSVLALELAREAIGRNPRCYLPIAGTANFWSSGSALDAHIGALATLQPDGWFLTVVRTGTSLPVPAATEEVHGLCTWPDCLQWQREQQRSAVVGTSGNVRVRTVTTMLAIQMHQEAVGIRGQLSRECLAR
jgi:hypothetical protein